MLNHLSKHLRRSAFSVLAILGVLNTVQAEELSHLLTLNKDKLMELATDFSKWETLESACAHWVLQVHSTHETSELPQPTSWEETRVFFKRLNNLDTVAKTSVWYQMYSIIIDGVFDKRPLAEIKTDVIDICRKYETRYIRSRARRANPKLRKVGQ